MPRPRKKSASAEGIMPPEEKGAEPSGSTVKIKLAERLELAARIQKTAAVLEEMLQTLKKAGCRKELLERAREGLELGILASMWALDYVDDNGNIILINHHEQQRKEDNEHN